MQKSRIITIFVETKTSDTMVSVRIDDSIREYLLENTESKLSEMLAEQFHQEVVLSREKWMEDILRNCATPPVKGEITAGKLKWRGIRLCVKTEGIFPFRDNVEWIEQRGKAIGHPFSIKLGFNIEKERD